MAAYNKILMIGNLTKDVELKYIPNGNAVADISIAINDSYTNKSGEKIEQTEFVDIVVWGRQAETSSEYLSKGSLIMVEGKWQTDRWENEAGEKRSRVRVRADWIQFLSTKKQSTGTRPPSVTDSKPSADIDEDDIPF